MIDAAKGVELDAGTAARCQDRISQAKTAAVAGDHAAAFALLRELVSPDDAYVDQARVARALPAVDLAALGLRRLRVALVAGTTMEHFAPVLRYWLARAGFCADLLLTPFDTTIASVSDPDSALYRFAPDIVWLFATYRDVELSVAPAAAGEALDGAVARAVGARRALWATLRQRLSCLVIDNNADIPGEDAFGNLAGAAAWGSRTLLRRYNATLAEAAPSGVAIFDLDHLAALYGKRRWNDPRYWFHSRHAFALDATGLVAQRAAQLIAGASGLGKKCLVLDLDNTLWGGVIGDDGLAGIALGAGTDGEAFTAFQCFVKALKERGIILAACSKNDHAVAASVFQDHPDCVLRLDDFAAFVANWDNKADNLRAIAHRLNIGLDALVFVDDNPAERDIVRRHLPEVAVVELPEDPALFVAAVAEGAWFETAAFSAEDRARGRYYAENAQREAAREAAVDMPAYLDGLQMTATIGGPDPLHLPRIAQLINKSNQFHLTGTRYGESELIALGRQPGCFVRHVRLRDRFGDNGLIASLVLRRRGPELHIDTWVMSCRVLARSVEEFIANEMRRLALAAGCDRLVGRYVPSGRNGLVSGLYERLGFARAGDAGDGSTWVYDIDPAAPGWTSHVHAAATADEPLDA